MTQSDSTSAINRLLIVLYRSLPMYLADAAPWTHPGDEKATQLLGHIVSDYRMYVGRIVEVLLSRRTYFSFGEYPMAFTDTHDLSLDYLISELVYYQKQDVAEVEKCVAEINTDLSARALAEEVLGNLRGHLESLEELAKQMATAAA